MSTKMLVIWQEIPEDVKCYLIDAGSDLATRALALNNKFVGMDIADEDTENAILTTMDSIVAEAEEAELPIDLTYDDAIVLVVTMGILL